MSTRTLILVTVLVFVTAGLFWLALATNTTPSTQIPTPQTPPVTIITPLTPQTVLSFDEVSMSSKSANTYSLPIVIDTKKNIVTAVQLELLYDPQVLTNVSIKEGSFFTNPTELLNDVDSANGRISYAIGISPQDSGVKGEGIVAILTFKSSAKTAKATKMSFLPKTLVTAEGTTQSVLKTTVPTQFIVGENVQYTNN